MAWSKSARISTMLAIDVAFFLLELIVGLIVGSLALMADAFHMLNDIISLLVGLWAVKAAQRSSSDKYSFGWLRAEILGAFFNAVFLIALCLSIVLEAITRLIDPPEISNPKLILIVGSLGLLSNLVGFFVLGGHGHSHGGDDHDHDHDHEHSHAHSHSPVDKLRAAEEGVYDESENVNALDAADENGRVADILPEGVLARTQSRKPSESPRHIRFTASDETASTSRASDVSPLSKFNSRQSSRRNHRRRASSVRSGRLSNIEDLSIHPASFRQEIIAASKPQVDSPESEESAEEAVDEDATEAPTERSPLLAKGANGKSHNHDHDHGHHHESDDSDDEERRPRDPRRDSLHASHNHNKPKKASSGHGGHNHADMGMRAMILHVIGDALGNVGVIVSALVIWLTPWSGRFYADPAVSLFITIIILHSTIPLTTATAKILLQATPDHLDVDDIKEDIQDIPGVVSCHHVHIWQLSDSQIVASMHIEIAFPLSEKGGEERYMELAKAVRKCLHAYGIHSATVQPEFCLDKAHDHTKAQGNGHDAEPNGPPKNPSCLLGCVEDCEGNGCCGGNKTPETQSNHSHDHDHDEHDHDHEDHSHGHEH